MIGSTQRRLFRASSLAILLVLAVLAWPAANLRGQDKKEGPAPKSDVKQPETPPPPVPTTAPPLVQVQPTAPPVTGGSSAQGPGAFPGQRFQSGFTPASPIPLIASIPPPPRFPVTIDPKTPVKDLLPAPSKIKNGQAVFPMI